MIKEIKYNGLILYLYKDDFDDNKYSIGGFDSEGALIDISFKRPLKKKIDDNFLRNKVNNYLAKKELEKTDYYKIFKSLEFKHLNYYATTTGLSIVSIFNKDFFNDVETIETFLKAKGIEYKSAYSRARWVLNIKISLKRDNLEKLKNLV